MGQTLDDQTMLYDAFKDKMIDVAEFEKSMGFLPSKLPFYFALLGDASDNIPGVKGIGKVTAQELVMQYASLDDLYAHIDHVKPPRAQAALREHKDNAYLSEKLFTLYSPHISIPLDSLNFDERNWSKARPLFQELQFKSLLTDVGQVASNRTIGTTEEKIARLRTYDFVTVTTQEQLDDLIALMNFKKEYALDTETDGLAPLQAKLVGLSICCDGKQAFYIPLAHTTGEQQLPTAQVVQALKPLLENSEHKKYLHSAKFDQLVLHTNGIELAGLVFDTLIAGSLITKDWQRIGLKEVSAYYLQEQMLTFKEVVTDRKYKNFTQVPLELATLYAANDALQTWGLLEIFRKELTRENMESLYYDLELPTSDVLYEMEKVGIPLDVSVLQAINVHIVKDIELLVAQIIALAGEQYQKINLNSPKQIEELLFSHLQLPPKKKNSKTGGYSTDAEVLQELSALHPIPGLLLKYRELFKLKSTYIDSLPNFVNPATGRIHTTFSQTRVATGRLSSLDPNLQNIPAEGSGYGLQIRSAFVAPQGKVLISADYSQIELRILAHVSQDQNLINAFLAGYDIHAQTASRLFDIPLESVTSTQRQVGKRINFSILYGLTPYGLSKDLDIPLKEARIYIDKYFAQYPAVLAWMDTVVQETRDKGYVTTLAGRRRYIPAIYERNRTLYEEARRVAINTVTQGTAAEIVKKGMLVLQQLFADKGWDAHMLLQIHDELIISVPKSIAHEVEKAVKIALESVEQWEIALKVNTQIGSNWMEITK
jgi:DNA polymerase-1